MLLAYRPQAPTSRFPDLPRQDPPNSLASACCPRTPSPELNVLRPRSPPNPDPPISQIEQIDSPRSPTHIHQPRTSHLKSISHRLSLFLVTSSLQRSSVSEVDVLSEAWLQIRQVDGLGHAVTPSDCSALMRGKAHRSDPSTRPLSRTSMAEAICELYNVCVWSSAWASHPTRIQG